MIETGEEGVFFVISRGLNDRELEVAAMAYKAITTRVGMYSVSKQLLD